MKRYTLIQALALSFYSRNLYVDVARNWSGIGIRYLLLLLTLAWAILTFMWSIYLSKFNIDDLSNSLTNSIFVYDNLSAEDNINRDFNILKQMPLLRFRRNLLTMESPEFDKVPKAVKPKPKPYLIKDPVSNNDLIIIDTSGTYKNLKGQKAKVLITEKQIVTKSPEGEDIFYLSTLDDETDTQENWNNINKVLTEIPLLKLKDGILAVGPEISQPIKIDNPGTKKTVIIIDTTDKSTKLFSNNSALLLLGKDSFFIKNPRTDEVFNYHYTILTKAFTNQTIHNFLSRTVKFFSWFGPLIVIPILLSLVLLFLLFIIIGYAGAASIFSNILHVEGLSFKDCFRLSTVALTPLIILEILLPEFLPHQDTIYFLISIGYLFFAVQSNIASITNNRPGHT